jgi:beta-lactamase regulating signal transducer with metallopeptidase domain/ankyrin repeat protein
MIAAALSALEAAFGWVWEASWQASVLAGLVLFLQAAFRAKLNPRWRYALWLLVLVRLVLPVLPESALSLFQFAPAPPVSFVAPVTEPLFAPMLSPPSPTEKVVSMPGAHLGFSLYSLLALLWLAGGLILLFLTWQVNRRFARQVAQSPEITDAGLLQIFASARNELDIRRSVRLIESGQVQSPAIMGLFSPTLLLPVHIHDSFDATELRLIFLHELAHLKRGDLIAQGVIAFLQIIHWFNPVLWFAFRRMRADREPATDALVLSRAGEAEKERYGLMLVKLLEHFNQRHSLPTLVGILEDKDQFKRRFSLIARFTKGAYGWSLLGILLIGLLSLACLTKSKATEVPKATESSLGIKNPALTKSLTDAARKGNLAEVENLLKQGADSNAKGSNGLSVLYTAVAKNRLDVVTALLQYGADPNRSNNGWDQVLFAAWNAPMLKVLLEGGANPNVDNGFGTPLAEARDAESVRLLVQHGANLNPNLKYGVTLVESAIGSGVKADVVNELIKQGATFDPKGNGAGALARAAARNNVQIIQMLLDRGVSSNAYSDEPLMQTSALHNAAWEPSPDAVKLLLERGANPEGDPRDDDTPLAGALFFGRTENTDLLRKAGAHDVGNLSIAAALGDTAKVSDLLNSGANLNETDRAGNTPLYYAVRRAHVEITQLLLARGANVNQFNSHGMTPFLSLRLMEMMGQYNTNQYQADWNISNEEGQRRMEAFKALFAKYPSDPNYRDSQGRTALHQMAFSGNTMVNFLTGDKTHPADPNLQDHDGNPPLLLAALSPRAKETFTQISTPENGDTVPKKMKEWNAEAYIAYQLIKAGARLDLVLANGRTVGELAMEAAQKANNPQLVSVLRDAGVAENGPASTDVLKKNVIASTAPESKADPGSDTTDSTDPDSAVPISYFSRDNPNVAAEAHFDMGDAPARSCAESQRNAEGDRSAENRYRD